MKTGSLMGVFKGKMEQCMNEGLIHKIKERQHIGERGFLLTGRCVLSNEQLFREQRVCSPFILLEELC